MRVLAHPSSRADLPFRIVSGEAQQRFLTSMFCIWGMKGETFTDLGVTGRTAAHCSDCLRCLSSRPGRDPAATRQLLALRAPGALVAGLGVAGLLEKVPATPSGSVADRPSAPRRSPPLRRSPR
jgi:hypothetical protein